jgi:hypothetical protein
MKILYLDDSGKVHPSHSSKYAVFAGFSLNHSNWHSFTRQITGAKARFFPGRGNPNDWELKSSDFLTRNAWNRAKNRVFCDEMLGILKKNNCKIYSIYVEKRNATKALSDIWVAPKCFQVLASKFVYELNKTSEQGVITCDWSSYSMDGHISDCVRSFVITRRLDNLIGGVTYGSSKSFAPIQVCDLIAGSFRIWLEGGHHLDPIIDQLRSLLLIAPSETDVLGYPVNSEVKIF